MLKMMKYEFIHSMRSFLLSFSIFWIACLLLPLFTGEYMPEIPVFSGLIILGFTILMMGIIIALFISIITRYYHSMFKRPAYLTLTLPVSSWQLIESKVIVSFLWLIIGFFALLFGISLTALMTALINHEVSLGFVLNTVIPDVVNNIVQKVFNDFPAFLNNSLIVAVGIYYTIISIYFSLTVVHTKICRRHRLVVALIIWFVLELFVSQLRGLMADTYIISIFFNLFVSVLLTVATVYIIDRHIEIE